MLSPAQNLEHGRRHVLKSRAHGRLWRRQILRSVYDFLETVNVVIAIRRSALFCNDLGLEPQGHPSREEDFRQSDLQDKIINLCPACSGNIRPDCDAPGWRCEFTPSACVDEHGTMAMGSAEQVRPHLACVVCADEHSPPSGVVTTACHEHGEAGTTR